STKMTVTNGATYYYVISAINPANDEARSAEVSATLPLPTPVTLAVGMFTNGQFSIQFPSSNGLSYVIETSSNLLNWIPAFTNISTNGAFIFHEANATNSQRFYRV